jgi:tRNA modification GTPase
MDKLVQLDTIVAISTPICVGAIGIVRLSGPQSSDIVDKLFRGSSTVKSNQLQLGWIYDGKNPVDQVLLIQFKSPHSYTAEDMVEIHCHGAPVILQTIVELCVSSGARRAEAGEFTKRAFLAGKLDLTQAEAVGELIHAESEQQARVASRQLAGGLSKEISSIKQQLVSLAAAETASLDFSEEDIADMSDQQYLDKVQQVSLAVANLLQQQKYLPIVQHGILVSIVGLPNAGKSTLLNTILGYERSIVTELSGTTRDTITEAVSYKGIQLHFTDTAGLRSTTDKVESIGVERTKQALQTSDVVLVLIESTKQDQTIEYLQSQSLIDSVQPANTLVVYSKADKAKPKLAKNQLNDYQSIEVSAKAKSGIVDLLQAIYDLVVDQPSQLDISVITERQFLVLKKLAKLLGEVESGLKHNDPRDVLLVALQDCVEAMAELDGSSASEAIIAEIFRNFCIGK